MLGRSLLALLGSISIAAAEGPAWPQFRGAAGDNVATSAQPTDWDESTVAWSIDLPGSGWSCPIVAGGRAFLTSATPTSGGAYRFEVHALDVATGKNLWTRVATQGTPRSPIHRDNSHATETPVTDGRRVVAYFGMTGCFCFTVDGEPLWSKDLGVYAIANDWGPSSSPVLVDGRVVLQIDNEEQPHLVALDIGSGEQQWRVDRPDERTNWSTPLVWRNSLRTELVIGGKTVRSYDPATGAELWSMPIGGRSSATASAAGDTLFIGSENRSQRGGTPGGLFAVSAGASGELDVFDQSRPAEPVLWANHRGGIGISSPLVYDGLIYAPSRRRGVVAVHDAATGAELSKSRIAGASTFWASPWAAAGRVFLLDERGVTFVVEP
ncbi:MAG: PQQ-binding-like beta-propeller repeat protein, partial [Planctomycetota bacterium]